MIDNKKKEKERNKDLYITKFVGYQYEEKIFYHLNRENFIVHLFYVELDT